MKKYLFAILLISFSGSILAAADSIDVTVLNIYPYDIAKTESAFESGAPPLIQANGYATWTNLGAANNSVSEKWFGPKVTYQKVGLSGIPQPSLGCKFFYSTKISDVNPNSCGVQVEPIGTMTCSICSNTYIYDNTSKVGKCTVVFALGGNCPSQQ